jgi:hypothetical protein
MREIAGALHRIRRIRVAEKRPDCELTETVKGEMETLDLPTWSATAELAALSRALGGYHIPADNNVGLKVGRAIAVWRWPRYQAYFEGRAGVRSEGGGGVSVTTERAVFWAGKYSHSGLAVNVVHGRAMARVTGVGPHASDVDRPGRENSWSRSSLYVVEIEEEVLDESDRQTYRFALCRSSGALGSGRIASDRPGRQ